MESLVISLIILFGLVIVYVLYTTTQGVPNHVEELVVDSFQVSYVFLPTDAEFGALKGFDFVNNVTVVTKSIYQNTIIKTDDIVKYKHKKNVYRDVELV